MANVKNGQSAIMPKTHTIIKGLDIYTQVPKDSNGIPVIRRCTRIPQGLVSFTEIGGKVIPEGHAVHFFLHDQKFECVWPQPNRYLNVLSKQFKDGHVERKKHQKSNLFFDLTDKDLYYIEKGRIFAEEQTKKILRDGQK